jgi:hypothetical protein
VSLYASCVSHFTKSKFPESKFPNMCTTEPCTEPSIFRNSTFQSPDPASQVEAQVLKWSSEVKPRHQCVHLFICSRSFDTRSQNRANFPKSSFQNRRIGGRGGGQIPRSEFPKIQFPESRVERERRGTSTKSKIQNPDLELGGSLRRQNTKSRIQRQPLLASTQK